MVTDARFRAACEYAVAALKGCAPVDTGNLKYNAVRIEWVSEKECKIYVDESIAPYMPYTNEPWISPRWNGKKNPNEKWWQNACELAIGEIANYLGGELSKNDHD